MAETRKRIFYFDEDPEPLRDYFDYLSSHYYVEMGAAWELVKKKRDYIFDLVILDLMIHRKSSTGNPPRIISNAGFPKVNWRETGIEFLHRIRKGEYQEYGFASQVPAIVATAVAVYPARERAEDLGINGYLEKPFSFEELLSAVDQVLNPLGAQRKHD